MRAWFAFISASGQTYSALCSAFELLEGGSNVLGAPNFGHVDFKAKFAGQRLYFADFLHRTGIGCIRNQREVAKTWEQFA